MIREARREDASQLLELMYLLDKETDFMMLEPGERSTTVEEQEGIIEMFSRSDNRVMLVAVEKGEIVGYTVGIGNSANRASHSMYCVIGMRQSAIGKGNGARLLDQLQGWAVGNGFTRIELTVMEHNERAKRLYVSQGFMVEGLKRNSLKVNGRYVNELYMAKLLG